MKKLIYTILLTFFLIGCSNKSELSNIGVLFNNKYNQEIHKELIRIQYQEEYKNKKNYIYKSKNNNDLKNEIYKLDKKNNKWILTNVKFPHNYFDLNKNFDFDYMRDINNIIKRENYMSYINNYNEIWTKEFIYKYYILPRLKVNKIENYEVFKLIDKKNDYNERITDNIFYFIKINNNFLNKNEEDLFKIHLKNKKYLKEYNKEEVILKTKKILTDNFLLSLHDDNFLYFSYLKNFRTLIEDLNFNTTISRTNFYFNSFFIKKYNNFNKDIVYQYIKNKIKSYYYYNINLKPTRFYKLLDKDFRELINVKNIENYIRNKNIEKNLNEEILIKEMYQYYEEISLNLQINEILNDLKKYKYKIKIKEKEYILLLDNNERIYKIDNEIYKIYINYKKNNLFINKKEYSLNNKEIIEKID